MDSTNLYASISIIALFFCLPPTIIIEGPQLMQFGFADTSAKVRLVKFLSDLFRVGMLYYLYNQPATNTLERVAQTLPRCWQCLEAGVHYWFLNYCVW